MWDLNPAFLSLDFFFHPWEHWWLKFQIWTGVTTVSDFAVRGQVSQSVDNISEGRTLFEAQCPAANHQLVDFGGTSIWNWKLQLSCLQAWNIKEWKEMEVKVN